MQSTNPKDVAARKSDKAPLDFLEPAGDEAISRALADGAAKYGPRNYVESPIEARIYIAAMRRHLTAYLRGEDNAEDSGVHHLGHVGACCHIVLAAIEAGTFIDNRHAAMAAAATPEPEEEETEVTGVVFAIGDQDWDHPCCDDCGGGYAYRDVTIVTRATGADAERVLRIGDDAAEELEAGALYRFALPDPGEELAVVLERIGWGA
jgi:hypothetical protein